MDTFFIILACTLIVASQVSVMWFAYRCQPLIAAWATEKLTLVVERLLDRKIT